MQWNNLIYGPNLMDTFSMAHVFCMQLINLLFYSFLTWYIDAVSPGDFGTPQPWFFPFSVSHSEYPLVVNIILNIKYFSEYYKQFERL